MLRARVKESLGHIGRALEEPEYFVLRWHREGGIYPWWIFLALAVTAILGTLTYGMTMGFGEGPARMVTSGLIFTMTAGIAWSLPLPALYILNSLTGSRLEPSTTLLAALVTTSWGGLAMIASLPINLFFTAALPYPLLILLVNLVVFAGVGISMLEVFGRVMETLEPARGRRSSWWLVLVGVIGAELFYAFGLFHFFIR